MFVNNRQYFLIALSRTYTKSKGKPVSATVVIIYFWTEMQSGPHQTFKMKLSKIVVFSLKVLIISLNLPLVAVYQNIRQQNKCVNSIKKFYHISGYFVNTTVNLFWVMQISTSRTSLRATDLLWKIRYFYLG